MSAGRAAPIQDVFSRPAIRWRGRYALWPRSKRWLNSLDLLFETRSRDVPILEDYELVRRLEKRGKTAYIRDVRVLASARRFEAHPFRTLLIWVLIQSLFMVGVPPKRLARLYADLR